MEVKRRKRKKRRLKSTTQCYFPALSAIFEGAATVWHLGSDAERPLSGGAIRGKPLNAKLGEDVDADVHEDEDVDEDVHKDEDVDEDVDEDEDVHEDVHEDVECESFNEESLVDITIQCDIGTSKGKMTKEPCTPLVSAIDNEEDEDDIGTYGRFPTFTMPKSLDEYKWEENGRKYKWYAYCAYMCGVNSWQLRKIIDDHNCTRDFNIKDKVSRKWNVGISQIMDFKARNIAKDNVEGSFKEQFRRIYDYGHDILRTNPGSTMKIKACKDGFIFSRPIIGLDGCFLKGKYGGELLTVVERDANEQILPITYVVVEVENKDSWTWFLEPLIEDLGGEVVCASCTFISDQRKSEMRNINEVNLEYFITIPPRSRFTPTSKRDTLVNNMCKALNNVLVHTRSKLIITMLEDIRVYIMKSWAMNRTKMASYQEITSYADVLPSKKRTMPGRPKKKRRLEAWEMKKNKGGTRKRYGVYKKLGHKKKSCPQRPPIVVLPTEQSTQQTEVTISPPTDVLPTQQSIVLPTQQSTVLPTQQWTDV
ncbi:hypothetical protein V8G54_007080 [Vigna mungo]|uniref:MULE transposase domain-containing protein n=1 Tax=Vigna mungo TaxID=3915 RepID=A0AAQ3S7Y9_VIGMU